MLPGTPASPNSTSAFKKRLPRALCWIKRGSMKRRWWVAGRPYHFIVRLRSAAPLDEELIRTIIEQEKPVFCTYDLSLEARS
jgi:hypothetical protein